MTYLDVFVQILVKLSLLEMEMSSVLVVELGKNQQPGQVVLLKGMETRR